MMPYISNYSLHNHFIIQRTEKMDLTAFLPSFSLIKFFKIFPSFSLFFIIPCKFPSSIGNSSSCCVFGWRRRGRRGWVAWFGSPTHFFGKNRRGWKYSRTLILVCSKSGTNIYLLPDQHTAQRKIFDSPGRLNMAGHIMPWHGTRPCVVPQSSTWPARRSALIASTDASGTRPGTAQSMSLIKRREHVRSCAPCVCVCWVE